MRLHKVLILALLIGFAWLAFEKFEGKARDWLTS